MSNYRFFDRLRADAAAERRAIVAGLLASAPAIAPKHFYDPVGSARTLSQWYRRSLKGPGGES